MSFEIESTVKRAKACPSCFPNGRGKPMQWERGFDYEVFSYAFRCPCCGHMETFAAKKKPKL